jgi:hypothetical protein
MAGKFGGLERREIPVDKFVPSQTLFMRFAF